MSTKTEKAAIAVTGVEIEIGGTKLKLTLDQVAELKKILAKAFPEPETKVVHVPGPERIIERQRPHYPPQWPWDDKRSPKWRQWEITCGSVGQTGTLKLAATQ